MTNPIHKIQAPHHTPCGSYLYVLCPICGTKLAKSQMGIRSHLRAHERRNEITAEKIIDYEQRLFPPKPEYAK